MARNKPHASTPHDGPDEGGNVDSRGENGVENRTASGEPPPVDELVAGAFDEIGSDMRTELAECQDRLLRLGAEMENVRRRTAREVQDERRYGSLPLVRDLLGILDNIERAVESGEKAPDATSLLEGFRLVGKQVRSVLEKHDIQPIAAEGEQFDPNLHQAILQQPSAQPSGTVVMVTQQGYRLHDRVVRPSQVIVSAGQGKGTAD